MNERPTHLDLFSGIGGFSLAFESAGFETIGFSEVDPYASAVLKKHWPNVINYGDVRTIPTESLVGRVDVITGGFPCQPFSVAGKRRGKDDHRHLWPAMLRVIDAIRPAWVCGENVPGIIGMALESVLSDLEASGYQCATFIVPACAVGAPHIRDRVWIVAHTNGERPQSRGHRSGEQAQQSEAGNGSQALADAARERCGEAGRVRHDESSERIARGGEIARMADALGVGEREQANEADTISTGGQAWDESRDGRQSLAYTMRQQTERHDARGLQQESARNGEAVSDASGSGREEFDAPCESDSQGHGARRLTPGRLHWSTDAGILRVADGIPNRVQRIKCLGNSIVHYVAKVFAKAIYTEIQKANQS